MRFLPTTWQAAIWVAVSRWLNRGTSHGRLYAIKWLRKTSGITLREADTLVCRWWPRENP